MKIFKIKIQNYRILKDISIDIEENLSLIIGKNNCGKTSFLSILEKLIGTKPSASNFLFEDFNMEFQNQLKALLTEDASFDEFTDEPYFGISLKLFISYTKEDNLANIEKLMMDLDDENNVVVLSFGYALFKADFAKTLDDYRSFLQSSPQKHPDEVESILDGSIPQQENGDKQNQEIEAEILNESDANRMFTTFLRKTHRNIFKPFRHTIEFKKELRTENSKKFVDIDKEKISLDGLLNFKFINARREVSNKESDKTLSSLSSKYYEIRQEIEKESDAIKEFQGVLNNTDLELDKVYLKLFNKIIHNVKVFGGTKAGESVIKIVSTLQQRELLKGNTSVVYSHNEHNMLPESYNGLGYLNLISMIFEIEILLNSFRKEGIQHQKPSDINLLFIEEPEAHTHPQMQYIFIKNIKDILRKESKGDEDMIGFNLQTIITTHSSHITSESDFHDIKYFKRLTINEVVSKNLKDLESQYLKDKDNGQMYFRFLKQYLTLNRAELFFADKAILIEGDTERILIPAMMKKLDCESEDMSNPLLSQNISILEVGNYSHIFEKFIDFLGIRTLIITDIDSKNDEGPCRVSQATKYTNSSIQFFFQSPKLAELIQFNFDKKKFNKIVVEVEGDEKKETWGQDVSGMLCIVYQTDDEGYIARSFEDAFLNLNRNFVSENKDTFQGLKNRKEFLSPDNDPFDLATKCIDKKPQFVLDILLHSNDNYANWQIPTYINEGLKWLKNNN